MQPSAALPVAAALCRPAHARGGVQAYCVAVLFFAWGWGGRAAIEYFLSCIVNLFSYRVTLNSQMLSHAWGY